MPAKDSQAKELRLQSADQLKESLVQLRKEQLNFRFQRASGNSEGVGRVRSVRRSIARIKTILGEQQKPAAS